MKFRFTIGRKILLGFGALIFLVLLAFSLTLVTIRKSGEINDKIANLYTPSVDKLQEMRLMITRSKMYLTNWVNIQTSSQDKDKLKRLIDEEYPNMKKDIQTLSKGWSQKDSALIKYIFISCDSLWIMHHQVMNDLNSFDSYDDPSIVFLTKPRVLDEDGDITVQTRNISDLLDHLIRRQYDAASAKRTEMLESFQTLSFVVMLLLIVLPLGGILIAFLTTRSITKPVSSLISPLIVSL